MKQPAWYSTLTYSPFQQLAVRVFTLHLHYVVKMARRKKRTVFMLLLGRTASVSLATSVK